MALSNSKVWLVQLVFILAAVPSYADEPFEAEQWGLHNKGKPTLFEARDLYTVELPARAGEDIAIEDSLPEFHEGKRVRVAVLDTGVDLDHPNLKSQIVHDEKECEATERYNECLKEEAEEDCNRKFANVDANGNGYPLDCSGWNLTAGRNPLNGIVGNPNVADDTGHGTHIAGIIAAAANGTGIRGVSQNVEILPVKVIRTSPNSPVKPQAEPPEPVERTLNWPRGFVDVVARGMLYAIRSNAQIISLSLAWTPAADSPTMREMVALAQSKGILVVAAAGNDSADARVLPCQYDGVICVGSHNPDGTLSHFSNYGSFVDIAAPGLKILSTWPRNKRSLNFTSRNGYEVKNGTSMATPFVVGVLARMISTGMSPREAYARMILGARKPEPSQQKFLRSGNIDFKNSLAVQPQPLILQAKKAPISIAWDRVASKIPIRIDLKNFWIKGAVTSVQARLIRDGNYDFATLSESSWAVGDWEADESKLFQTDLNISNPMVSGRLSLEVTVQTASSEPSKFRIPLEIYIPVKKQSGVFGANIFPIRNGSVEDLESLRTVSSMDGQSLYDYISITEEGGRQKLKLLAQRGNDYFVSAVTDLPKVDGQLLLIQRVDVNLDGNSQYVFVYRIALSSADKGVGFKFCFFDRDLNLIRTQDYDNKTSTIPQRFQWLSIRSQNKIGLAPTWLAPGYTPAPEKPPFDPWDKNPSDTYSLRLYSLGVEGVRTVSLPEGFNVVQLLAQSGGQIKKGSATVILSQGKDYKQKYFFGELSEGKVQGIQPLALDHFRMLSGLLNIVDITSLSSTQEVFGTSFGSAIQQGGQRSQLLFSSLSPNSSFADVRFDGQDGIQKPPSIFDSVVQISGAYVGSQRRAVFSQTQYLLQYQDLLSGEVSYTDLDRFSFLPAFIFSSTMFPVAVQAHNSVERIPGILIPSSSGISSTTEVVIPVYANNNEKLEGLIRPAKFRVVADQGCALIDNFIKEDRSSPAQIVLFCGDRFYRIPLVL